MNHTALFRQIHCEAYVRHCSYLDPFRYPRRDCAAFADWNDNSLYVSLLLHAAPDLTLGFLSGSTPDSHTSYFPWSFLQSASYDPPLVEVKKSEEYDNLSSRVAILGR